jgi:hypothetical protein
VTKNHNISKVWPNHIPRGSRGFGLQGYLLKFITNPTLYSRPTLVLTCQSRYCPTLKFDKRRWWLHLCLYGFSLKCQKGGTLWSTYKPKLCPKCVQQCLCNRVLVGEMIESSQYHRASCIGPPFMRAFCNGHWQYPYA